MSKAQPVRVLVLRTSRFADTAIAVARATWPSAEIRVAHQAGADAEIDAAGIAASARILLPSHARLSLASVTTSEWGWRARVWQPDHVVVQWWNARGDGHAAANRAALWLQPRGFHAVLDDGTRVWRSAPVLARQVATNAICRAFAVSALIAIPVAASLLWPAAAWHRRAERQRMSATS